MIRLSFIRETFIKMSPMVVLLMALYPNIAFGQSAEGKEPVESFGQGSVGKTEGTSEVKFDKDYLRGYISDTKYILTSPFRWEKSDWLKFSLVAGTTIGLFALDYDIQHWAQERRNSTTNKITGFFEPFGNGAVSLPTLGAFYLYGQLLDDKKAQTTGLLGLESFVLSGIFTQAIKVATHRQRPDEGGQSLKWDGPNFSYNQSHLSFPSADSTLIFSIATVIASEYNEIVWVPPLAYGIATLTALGRINDNDHWASDVFLGSAIGYFTAKAILTLHKKNANISIIPVNDGHVRGLAISLKF